MKNIASEISLKCVITIMDFHKGHKAVELYRKNRLPFQYAVHGRGTAASEIMDYLGLDEPKKDIILGLAPDNLVKQLLEDLQRELHFSSPGKGIAFTIPLSGINLAAFQSVSHHHLSESCPDSRAYADSHTSDFKKEGSSMGQKFMHEIIVSVVDSQHTDFVLEAAKEAGCSGGTVVLARSIAAGDSQKIFGITIEPEKEIIFILVPHEKKQAILKAICNRLLKETKEHGLAFSLPVSDVIGMV